MGTTEKNVKRLRFVHFLLLLILLTPVQLSATTADGLVLGGEIRVGLTSKFSNLGSITISNTTIEIGFEGTWGFSSEARLTSSTGFVASADSSYYFSVGSFPTHADAERHAATLRQQGYRAVPCLTGINRWTVYIGGYQNEAAAQGDRIALGGMHAPINNRRIALMSNNVNIVIFDSPAQFPQFVAPTGYQRVTLGDSSYRGKIELIRLGGQNLTAVNIIGVEEYLYSVVPSEMPPAWPAEALKAQAVACRTYAATRRGIHNDSGFDICDAAHCQVYHGANVETYATTAAVRATQHVLIWHDGAPIQAVYFASSGGFTDHSENVWISAEPYLRSVLDINEREPRVWNRIITLNDLDTALNARHANIGRATNMHVSRMQNNRVQELIITGIYGTLTLTKEEIRTFFTPIGGILYSRNFTISGGSHAPAALTAPVHVTGATSTSPPQLIGTLHVRDADGNVRPLAASGEVITVRSAQGFATYSVNVHGQAPEGSFVLNGLGNGHGVGMSQAGARGMAENGFTFEQILRHYYAGVEIRRWR